MKKMFTLFIGLLSIFLLTACSSSVPSNDKELDKFIHDYNKAAEKVHSKYDFPSISERSEWREKEEALYILNSFMSFVVSDENFKFLVTYDEHDNVVNHTMFLTDDNTLAVADDVGSVYIKTLGLDVKRFLKTLSYADENWSRALREEKQIVQNYLEGTYEISVNVDPSQNNVQISVYKRNK